MKEQEHTTRRLILLHVATILVFALASMLLIPHYITKSAEDNAINSATLMANQFVMIREYYTENVISKVIANDTSITPHFDHKSMANAIPLPASFILDMSDLMQESSISLKFYSPYPFTNRKDRALDSFAENAWASLNENPQVSVTARHNEDNTHIVRVAIADTMINQVCVDCHNSHPNSPKTDWKLGDLRGVLEISSDISTQVKNGIWTGRLLALSLVLVFGTVTIFTFRKQRDEFLKNQNILAGSKRRAEMASVAKGEFLATMSHELRTPLNAIIGFSETLKLQIFGKLNADKQKEYVEDIHMSGIHLLNLINDILDVSAIEAGKLEFHEGEIDVGELVELCVRLVRPRAEKHDVVITVSLPDALPRLHADSRRVQQILLNLLSNAAKFSNDGGTITLEVEADDMGPMSFAVIDSGIGMNEQELAKAMEAFGQVGNSATSKYEGTGLGLPLTKSLVEMHGGTLEITSEKGVGTTVIAIFPPERVI